jgi:hypothetical protein
LRCIGGLTAALLACHPSSVTAQIAAWDFFGESSPSTSAADVFSTDLDSSSNVTRGASAGSSTGTNSFRTTGFQNNGIATTNTDWFQITLSPVPGKVLSLSTINARFAGTASYAASPGVSHQFSYSLDGTNFTLIGSPVATVGTPVALPEISLAGVPELQNVPPATTVYLRYYATGQTSTGGWGFNSPSIGAYGLAIGGTIAVDGPDTTAPSPVSFSPSPGSSNVAIDTNLVLTFDEAVTKLTGDIEIKDGTNTVTIPVTDAAQVTVSGTTVTINPTADLAISTAYHVLIDPGTFEDAAGNDFLGITSDTTWTFTTVAPDITGPAVVSVTPLNGATNVDPAVNPVITYDENLIVGTGNILIKRVSDNSTVSTLSVTDDAQVLVFNNQAFLTPPAPLPIGTAVYIEVPLGAFEDALGNDSPAYGGSGVWSFTTPVLPLLTSAAPYTQSFAGFTSSSTLPDGWTVTSNGSASNKNNYSAWNTTSAPNTSTGIKFSAATPVTNVLGYQHSSDTDLVEKTLTLVNDTGAVLTDLTVSYNGRQARPGVGRTPDYVVTVAGNTVASLAYITSSGDDVAKTGSVTGLTIALGATFTIVWSTNGDTAAGSGTREQIGISNVSVEVGSSLLPPAVAGVTPAYETLTSSSVSVSSEVTADGGDPITERGFVFSLTSENASPEIGGTGVTTIPDDLDEVGTYSAVLSGLTPASQYAIRSYATNSEGTAYSGVTSVFTLANPPSFVTSYSQPFDNFNGTILTGTLPAGWSVTSSGGLNGFAGTWAPATSSGGLLGNVDTPNGVLGYQHVGTSGLVTATLTLTNDTGGIIDELYVAYTGRVNRITETREPEWAVSLDGTPVTELAYSTSAGVDEIKSTTITGLSIAPGATFTLTWVSDGNVGTGGGRRQIGIADVFVGLEAPPAGGYTDWATTNVGGDPANVDTDGDGVPNGVEYFMGETGSTFTTNPSPDATGTVTWVRDPSATGVTFKVRTSPDLQTWTDVELTDPALTVTTTSVSYALPTATAGPLFVRLEVTVPPAP